MEIIQQINFTIAVLFFICYSYQLVYLIIPYIKKPKPHKPVKLHRYAVLISARNEEAVIGQLIDSIHRQDYPGNLIDIFVVADNCTDHTADTARHAGAVVFERFNTQQVGKGYALNFLLHHIGQLYPSTYFDGFFVFDADNLLSENYVTEMNKAFSDGDKILTSYRNSKNYGDNWISAGYALWFLREAKYLNNPRKLLGTSCAVSGTGFLMHRNIIEQNGGWNFFLLTEDIEFSVHSVIQDEKIGYCGTAILYDEQPTTFRQSWRQRLRWSKGYLQVFRRYGAGLLKGIFKKPSFSCYDMAMSIMPAIVLSTVSIFINLICAIYGIYNGHETLTVLFSVTETLVNSYLFLLFLGIVTTISEWKQIHTRTWKKILYTFTFPLFMLTYIPISFTALFKKVEWKPIEHHKAMTLTDLQRTGQKPVC